MMNNEHKKEAQEYDNTLKALFSDEVNEIIPLLLPGIEPLDEMNIELDRSKLKADLMYNAISEGESVIVNLELQITGGIEIVLRVLQYHGLLHAKYRKTVISVIMYPFETNVLEPPFVEKVGDSVLLLFHYKVLCLWKLYAQEFVAKRALCMYTLLPAMQGATAQLLKRALAEMAAHYPSRAEFGHRLIRFHAIMKRTTTMSEQDKREVEEELYMQYQYDEFIDNNPTILQHMEPKFAEAEARGKLSIMRESVMDLVKMKFPTLVASAQKNVEAVEDPEALRKVFLELTSVSDEKAAQSLLGTLRQ